jgi:Spy/CpxP family protein refolding chaperone
METKEMKARTPLIIAAFAAFTAMAAFASAHPDRASSEPADSLAYDPGERREQLRSETDVFEGLELTASQRAQMSALREQTAATRSAILVRLSATGTPSAEDLVELARTAAEHNAAIRELLTEEQNRKLGENLKVLEARRAEEAQARAEGARAQRETGR